MIKKLRRLMREVKMARTQRKGHAVLDVAEDGFVFTRGKTSVAIKLDAVTKIAAGTHAILSGEIFYILIGSGGQELEIDEFADGFNDLEAALGRRFPSVREALTALQTTTATEDRLEVLWTSGDGR